MKIITLLEFAAAAAVISTPGAFPPPDRPVAPIVSSTWWDADRRDQAAEVRQLVQRLSIRPGTVIADIGAGDGYDSLRLATVVTPKGKVIAEDITAPYLTALQRKASEAHLKNIVFVLGQPADPTLPAHTVDVAIMVHMYHEIQSPYALLYNLAPAFKAGGRLGIEERDEPIERHGTPPKLLTCELAAVGYRRLSLSPLKGDLGYLAVFAPPTLASRPEPSAIKPCRGG